MKTIAILLFFASVALNVGFLTGCQSLHDAFYGKPCKYSQAPVQPVQAPVPPVDDDGKAELVRIADLLKIKTSGKSTSDLASDIRYELERDRGVPDVPSAYAEFEKLAKALSSKQQETMRKYHEFISALQGKKVIVIESEK